MGVAVLGRAIANFGKKLTQGEIGGLLSAPSLKLFAQLVGQVAAWDADDGKQHGMIAHDFKQ